MMIENSTPTPAQGNARAGLPFDLKESAVSRWLEKLSTGDKIESCKTVFLTLQILDQHEMDLKTRFAILEQFRSVVYWQSSHLASRVNGAPFPLESKGRKLAKLAAKFHSALASGYQLIANHSEFETTYSGYEQACILHRALRSIGISLLRVAQMYEPPPSKAWASLKKLYRKAESRQLLDIEIEDPLSPTPRFSSIARSFAAAILFSVSNPYRHSQTEMARLFQFFDSHSENIEVGERDPGHRSPRIGIDLDNDLPPWQWSSFGKFPNPSMRWIEVSKAFAALLDDKPREPISVPFQTSLLTTLHHLGKASNTRPKSSGFDAELTSGLEKIGALLKSEHSTPELTKGLPSADWLPSPDFELLPIVDKDLRSRTSKRSDSIHRVLRDHHPETGQARARLDSPFAKPSLSPSGQDPLYGRLHDCELPGHALVELKSDVLTIGQVLAIRGPGPRTRLGAIRWMQVSTQDQKVYYGIEQWSSKFSSVSVFISSRRYPDGLLLENTRSGISNYTLILPPVRYRSGTRLAVKQTHVPRNFILERLLETNPFFCHYALKATHVAALPCDQLKR